MRVWTVHLKRYRNSRQVRTKFNVRMEKIEKEENLVKSVGTLDCVEKKDYLENHGGVIEKV